MRIGLLLPVRTPSEDFPIDPHDNPDPDPRRHIPHDRIETFHIHKASLSAELMRITRQPFDVFINLCDGAASEDVAGIDVVRFLETRKLAFTGPSTSFYEPTRAQMKDAATAVGIKVPASIHLHSDTVVANDLGKLRFPLIVKHPESYNSIGLTSASRVENPLDLADQIKKIVGRFGGALVEAFIVGREFTVFVTEGRRGSATAWTFPPHEVVFPPGETFKHFDLKWRDFKEMAMVPISDGPLSDSLQSASRAIFGKMGGDGYARLDFRVAHDNEIFFLEINPACAIFMPSPESYGCADIILANAQQHSEFLEHLIERALVRAQSPLA
jgi:D-alanine-D-alanine ligase